jgi:hypothetical protein
MIPNKINDWTFDIILNLLKQGYYECEYFDFKEMLPHKNDSTGKSRLTKACGAFANQNGGFLIYGIKDDKLVQPEQRIVGIDNSIDFPEQFGNYPLKLNPSVQWEFLNPPIKLESGNLVHVIEIKTSLLKPVGYEDGEKGWFFSKRTNKGDELMSYEEIKLNFMNFYEKKIKLQLLLSELNTIERNCKELNISDERISTHFSLVKFNLKIVETVLSDTYTILYNEIELIGSLDNLRSTCHIVNNKIDLFLSSVMLPMTNKNEIVKSHNEFIKNKIPSVLRDSTDCIGLLETFLVKN